MSDLEQIINEISLLIESSKEDFEYKQGANYVQYSMDFNKLYKLAINFGVNVEGIDIITPVYIDKFPDIRTNGTSTEEIKRLREITYKAEKLLYRLKGNLEIEPKNKYKSDDICFLEKICSKFHSVVKQLKKRREKRQTLEVEDEYDVQDLLHALLLIFFDDIRTEEWTPSYAGGSSRMDFLIKDEQIVIETKKTRKGLGDKELGEELIIDIQKYSKHPDCKKLICFVYDPDGIISNPRGVERDLSRKTNELEVFVFIRPSGQ